MKAILMIDISSHNEKNYYAEIHIKNKQSHKKVKTFPHCNLKPLPHKDFTDEAEAYQTEEEYKAYVSGWNECIIEILGGKEE